MSILLHLTKTTTHYRIERTLATLRAAHGKRVFDEVLQQDLDYANETPALAAVLTRVGGDGEASAKALRTSVDDLFVGTDAVAFENSTMRGPIVDAVLLDLLMYEDDVLFAKSLELLLERSKARANLTDALTALYVLDKPALPVFGHFDVVDDLVSMLRIGADTSELWALDTDFSGSDPADV